MPVYVIDSWPILEWLQGREPVAARFAAMLERASIGEELLCMSRINYGEIVYTLHKNLPIQSVDDYLSRFQAAPISIHSVDDQLIDEAALLKSRFPLSYADCFAVALAKRLNAPVVTGDGEFVLLRDRGEVALEWVGL